MSGVVQPPKAGWFGDIEYEDPVCCGKHPEWFKPKTGVSKGLNVKNSLTEELDEFVPGKGNRVLWYTCGPTVYDACHLGHARAYLTFDILRRITEDYFHYNVLYHINITDIDDKIILKARVNHLIANYIAEKNDYATVLEKVNAALEAAKAELDARGEELAKPLAENSNSKAVKDHEDNVKVHELKKKQFADAVVLVEAVKNGSKDPTQLAEAARDALGKLLDKEKGASVTDHAIFDAHSKKYEKAYFDDMKALGVKEPDVLTRVTEYVPKIIDFIQIIVSKGLAYESNGSIYLSIEEFKKRGHSYRKLRPGADTTADEMAEGEGALAGGENEKRHKNDFTLWKKSKVGEPSWESPWGMGRPGWHIECSVVASDILGEVMDIHAGGSDLKFPHHDNEMAQSESRFGHGQWVNYFFHAGHLKIKGLKMAKSLKNFITIKQALAEYTAREIRMMFLLQSWHKEMNFADQTVEEAKTKEKTFREFFHKAKAIVRTDWANDAVGWQDTEKDRELAMALFNAQDQVDAAFRDNYDTPTAVLALYKLVETFNKYEKSIANPAVHLTQKIAMYITSIFRVLGLVSGSDSIGFGEEGGGASNEEAVNPILDAFVDFRTEVRQEARKKDGSMAAILKTCDNVRDEVLPPLGVRIDDKDDGKSLWKRDDPEVLMKEIQDKKDAADRKAREKLETKIKNAEAAIAKAKDVLKKGTVAEMFKKQEAYAGYTFSDDGFPEKDASGEPLAKSTIKGLQKLQKTQQTALDKLTKEYGENIEEGLKKKEEEIAALKSSSA